MAYSVEIIEKPYAKNNNPSCQQQGHPLVNDQKASRHLEEGMDKKQRGQEGQEHGHAANPRDCTGVEFALIGLIDSAEFLAEKAHSRREQQRKAERHGKLKHE